MWSHLKQSLDNPCKSRENNTEATSVPLRPSSVILWAWFPCYWRWCRTGTRASHSTDTGFLQVGPRIRLKPCSLPLAFSAASEQECLLYKWCHGGFIFCSILLPLGGSRDWWNERREGCPGWKRRQRATGITRKYPGSKQHLQQAKLVSAVKRSLNGRCTQGFDM